MLTQHAALRCSRQLLLLPALRTPHEHGAQARRGIPAPVRAGLGATGRDSLDAWLQGLYAQAGGAHAVDPGLFSHGGQVNQQQAGEASHRSTYGVGGTAEPSRRAGAAAAVAASSSSEGLSLQESKNPTRLDFDTMYAQLAGWAARHASCHVPRNCFDAPPLLGAWVRHMRRLHQAGKLAQWQQERLALLGFEWHLDDATAKWLNMYHLLRRHKAMHGHTHVSPATDFLLARWLDEQARLFAMGKLTQQQQHMLALAGAELAVPQREVEQAVQLQGLNAHERKKLRRKWREQAPVRPQQRNAAD